jgi:hypothetical protein
VIRIGECEAGAGGASNEFYDQMISDVTKASVQMAQAASDIYVWSEILSPSNSSGIRRLRTSFFFWYSKRREFAKVLAKSEAQLRDMRDNIAML